jgi:hypothetical protein
MNVDHYLWKKAGLSVSSTYCPECARKAKSEAKQIEDRPDPAPEK